MGEAKRKAARRPVPAPPLQGERRIDMTAAKIDHGPDSEAVTNLILDVAKACLAVGDASPLEAIHAYARTDGSLRVCVVMGELRQVIVAPGRWSELTAQQIMERERERFAIGPFDPASIDIPFGHVGFMVMLPNHTASVAMIPVNDFYAQIAAMDRKLDQWAPADDPRKSVEAFAAVRKDAFEKLALAAAAKDQEAVARAINTLLWASINTPGKASELRRNLSTAIAAHDRAGIVMRLAEYRDRVATLIGESLALPPGLEDTISTYRMSGVAETVFETKREPRKTN